MLTADCVRGIGYREGRVRDGGNCVLTADCVGVIG